MNPIDATPMNAPLQTLTQVAGNSVVGAYPAAQSVFMNRRQCQRETRSSDETPERLQNDKTDNDKKLAFSRNFACFAFEKDEDGLRRRVLRIGMMPRVCVIGVGAVTVVIDGETEMADQQFLHCDRENQKHEIEEPKNDDRHGGSPDDRQPQVAVARCGEVTGGNEYQQRHRQQDDAGDQSQERFVIVLNHRVFRFFKGVRQSVNRFARSVTFCPPKPKLLLAIMSQRVSRALFGM